MPKADPAKRRRIMQRSMKLGHCICDPRRPCPCDVFTEQGLCPCAGDRPDPKPVEQIRLTEHVHNAGCASKIAPADLERVLKRLPAVDDPAVISGIPAGDDAGIYQLAAGVRLVQTVDVFTPCVDDPRAFGRICAANCLSDIYAMGGVPRTALSILCFPAETLDGQIMYEMMRGAMDTLAEAGVALIGGHSIKDEEIKLGFAITGTVDDRAAETRNAAVGDVLVLTKPLGVGVLTFARQIGRTHSAGMAAAEASMAQLNKAAAEAMREVGAAACTDVTGFGLFGHLAAMVRASGVTAQVYADALPAFDGALTLLAEGMIPGAVERNSEFVGSDIRVAPDVPPERVALGFDAQTSGGLLVAVAEDRCDVLLTALQTRGCGAFVIGRIVSESTGRIAVTLTGREPGEAGDFDSEADDMPRHEKQAAEASCCGEDVVASPRPSASLGACCSANQGTQESANDGDQVPDLGRHGLPRSSSRAEGEESADVATPQTTAGASAQAFGALMRSVGQAGAIDARTKELLTFALVVHARCAPCVKAHLGKARQMGITQAELDEAAWCATAMGGAPVWMFYKEMTEGE